MRGLAGIVAEKEIEKMEEKRTVSNVEPGSAAVDDFFDSARRDWPTHFGIPALPSLAPRLIAGGTVHNAISAGVGPAHRKINGRIILERDSFLDWLQNRPRVAKRTRKAEDEAA